MSDNTDKVKADIIGAAQRLHNMLATDYGFALMLVSRSTGQAAVVMSDGVSKEMIEAVLDGHTEEGGIVLQRVR